jgi:hypothetical protein
MSSGGLPPPPTKAESGSFAWVDWYQKLNTYLSASGSVPWAVVDKAGSSLGDLQTRAHANLTAVAGGGSYHMSLAEYTGTGTGNFARETAPVFIGAVTYTGTLRPTTAGGYLSSDSSPGISTTITTGSLVGKTITVKDGLITGFA